MPAAVTDFHLNGQPVQVAGDGDVPLLHVLRNHLQLKGTRFGCGAGACGSCTVLVDGRAVQSCDLPTSAAQGCDITTVEGLGGAGRLHPVQRAFLDLQAAQCGYCINGVMMSVAALLQRPEPPTEEALQAALSRHLCRCGTHMRILRASRRALGLPEDPA
jgi:aerobic-type carbon monoxide dehydrogenase small subunit (CoxS/CutS family)